MSTQGTAANDTSTWRLELRAAYHPGLCEGLDIALCASARVCMHRHHRPTTTTLRVALDDRQAGEHALAWSEPTQRERNANRNHLDATRDGAYAVALVCLERKMNLVAVSRADHLTGADWYVAPPGRGLSETGEPNLDDPELRRLEVGGHDARKSLPSELKVKVQQVASGASAITGMAAVVGFAQAHVLICTRILPA